MGFYFGDGSKKELEFVTCGPRLLEVARNFFRGLGFGVNSLNYQLTPLKPEDGNLKQNAVIHWLSNGVPKVPSIFWHEALSAGSRKAEFGTVSVRYYSRFGGLFVYFLLQKMIEEVKKRPDFVPPFLQGCFAAEGSVLLQKDGKIMSVRYTETTEERRLIRQLLSAAGIGCVDYGSDLGISGIKNFLLIRKFDLLTLRTRAKQRFEAGLNRFLNS